MELCRQDFFNIRCRMENGDGEGRTEGTGSAYTIGKSGDVEFTEDLLERDSVELVVRGVGEILEIQERMQARADKG